MMMKLAVLISSLILGVNTFSVQEQQHVFKQQQAPNNNNHGDNLVSMTVGNDQLYHFSHSEYPDHRLRATQPNLCAEDVEQWSGYLDLPNDRHLFFWFFESRNDVKNDPVVMWINGGPGCSSMTGLAMELGPCRIQHDEKTGRLGLANNDFGWNANSSVIFLDQPVGVGFSHGNKTDRGVWDSEEAAHDVYTFLQIWFDVFRKDFGRSDLHIAGESYGGRYIPLIADYTMRQNEKNTDPKKIVPLKSVLIGNGITSPIAMYESYYPDACTDKGGYGPVIPKDECKSMKESIGKCRELALECEKDSNNDTLCIKADEYCEDTQFGPYARTGRNPYDMTLFGDYIEDAWVKAYFNQTATRWALGVDKQVKEFTGCSDRVFDHFGRTGDGAKPSYKQVANLLDKYGLDVLIYVGDKDFICNWISNEAWTLALEWDHHSEFKMQSLEPWYAKKNGNVEQAGLFRTAGSLTFATVKGAGHFVPFDQAEASLTFATEWIHHGPDIFHTKLSHRDRI